MTQTNKIYSEAAKLPRRHPLRFALLYGMGPVKLLDYVKKLAQPTKTERSIALESEIQCFENWQKNENESILERFAQCFPALRKPVGEDSRTLTADTVTSPTGRWAKHEPKMQ